MDHLCYLCLVFGMLSRLFITALWSSEGKGLTSWLLFVMFIVVLLLSYLVFRDMWGFWLYRFLILADFLTLVPLDCCASNVILSWDDENAHNNQYPCRGVATYTPKTQVRTHLDQQMWKNSVLTQL